MITWKQFKEMAERAGVNDDDQLDSIDVCGSHDIITVNKVVQDGVVTTTIKSCWKIALRWSGM